MKDFRHGKEHVAIQSSAVITQMLPSLPMGNWLKGGQRKMEKLQRIIGTQRQNLNENNKNQEVTVKQRFMQHHIRISVK